MRITATWLSKRPKIIGFQVALILTLLLMLGSQLYWKSWIFAPAWMPANFLYVFERGEVWRAWTTLFVHADEKHLLSNSLYFFILGSLLNAYFGFFIFPALTFFMGGVINLIVLLGMNSMSGLIGASGMVFWMGGVWLILYFFLDLKRTMSQRFLRVGGVSLALFMPAEVFDPQISYQSHLIGFVLGLLCGATYYLFKRPKFLKAVKRVKIYEATDN